MTAIKKNWLEWTVFYASLALVLGVVGYLSYDWATARGGAPELFVTLGEPERRGGGHSVPVKVTNRGERTAEGVRVEVSLLTGAGAEERGEFTAAFVPRGSESEGWVHFKTDPRAGRLEARVLGYEKP
jgi:uncharacterized protein (TIGR02588 family)